MPDDNELMVKIAKGDKQAFAELMHRHLPAVLNFNKQYLPQEAEDITQEAFLRLWNKAPDWVDQGYSAKTWILRVSYNLCIDQLRKHEMQPLDEQVLNIVDHQKTDEQLLTEQADFKYKIQALAALPERQRSAITLCAYNGLNNTEAAKVLNISVDALESLLARGRRTLRQKLKG